MYSDEPDNPQKFQQDFDVFYTRFAPLYGFLVSAIPFWSKWTSTVLPYVVGPRVLEVSFGTGHLMVKLARRHDTFGIDMNRVMARQTTARLRQQGLNACIQIGAVERIPYASGAFDSVVCTMALSGYPDGSHALQEMRRVLRPRGILAMVDVNYPSDGNWVGTLLTRFWKVSGDLIRDVPELFRQIGWSCTDKEVGARGSVHLYVAEK